MEEVATEKKPHDSIYGWNSYCAFLCYGIDDSPAAAAQNQPVSH